MSGKVIYRNVISISMKGVNSVIEQRTSQLMVQLWRKQYPCVFKSCILLYQGTTYLQRLGGLYIR
ncbi:hypothetical protein M758_N007800 [Ceratodon purpureus]|nr:hypothetical protein M758_N007800 [Ceratodon purpureus]